VKHTLSAQKLLYSTVDARVINMLKFVQKMAKRNPDVVYGDGEERSRDTPEMRAFGRKLASEGMVLLKNKSQVLPISGHSVKKVAIVGPGVHGRVISGGGSAALKVH
jgi:beta-glucosidase